MRLSLVALALSVAVSGCGTFRAGSGGYRGMGDYRTGSDYANGGPNGGGENDEDAGDDTQVAQQHLSGRSQYVPRYPFKLYWPVSQVRINRGFHPPSDPHHAGLDLGGARGTTILAAHEGVVIYAGRDFRGYGNMILIEYNNEWATLYGHLEDFAVNENTIVSPGDPIGTMGSTGHATGVHLHFEVMHNKEPMDPLTLLPHPQRYAAATAKVSQRRRGKHVLK